MQIHIIGWAGINHSYCIVAEEYIKGLFQYPELKFYFTEAPYYGDNWKKSHSSIFDQMPHPTPQDKFDLTFRIMYPYDLTPDPQSKCTVVFMTCEFNYLSNYMDANDVCDNVWILTPSEYSKRGIVRSGFKPEKIIVVPHGYEYKDIPATKEQLRIKHGIVVNDYVYFHNSSLTPNKNVMAIIECFDFVHKTNPNTTLFIKGADRTYFSESKLNEIIHMLSQRKKLTCENKIKYIGIDATNEEMAEYYKLSDCYVSPYLAEGFNLPVLEALCHGKHVICTQGGPTDEFADAYFIKSQIASTNEETNVNGTRRIKEFTMPSMDHLFQLMTLAPMFNKRIDMNEYRSKFCRNAIGNKLYEKFIHLIKMDYNIPEIVLIDNSEINKTIKNIQLFCDDIKIHIIVHDKNKKSHSENLIYTYLEKQHDPIQEVRNLMEMKKIPSAVYVSPHAILITDPRSIYVAHSNYVDRSKRNLITYLPNQTNLEETLLTTEECAKMSFKWCVKPNNVKILYLPEQNKNFIKVNFLHNTTFEDPSLYLTHKDDEKTSRSKFLHKADVAIMTADICGKYQSIFRSAPITILFDGRELEIDVQKIENLDKEKIFVYPEVLTFFFKMIYPQIKQKFKLFTFQCELTKDKKHLKMDVDKKITEFVILQ